MKGLPILVLLSSVVLLCSTAPALEPLTCTKDSGAAAANLAMVHINEHHDHGYKFRLNEVQGIKVEKDDNGCNIELQLDLLETTCHIVNPKHFQDCEIRRVEDRGVMANCTIMMTVKDSGAKVTKYDCLTRQVTTDSGMMMTCPDCPNLIPLNSPEGLKSVNEGVKRFNQNNSNQHYYILQEVGRIKAGNIMMAGMSYYAEFALVETNCPWGSRIVPEACKPLCPDRAHHALCRSSYSSKNGLGDVECEFYPPLNTSALGPGEQEPLCGPPPHAGGRGPPPHAGGRGQGPPPHAGNHSSPPHAGDRGHGPPPHARDRGHGPPPHAGGRGQGPPPHAGNHSSPSHAGGKGPSPHAGGRGRGHGPPPFRPCHGLLTNFDPVLHPICPWPHPEAHPHHHPHHHPHPQRQS